MAAHRAGGQELASDERKVAAEDVQALSQRRGRKRAAARLKEAAECIYFKMRQHLNN